MDSMAVTLFPLKKAPQFDHGKKFQSLNPISHNTKQCVVGKTWNFSENCSILDVFDLIVISLTSDLRSWIHAPAY